MKFNQNSGHALNRSKNSIFCLALTRTTLFNEFSLPLISKRNIMFLHFHVPVGKNAKPMDISVSGIYSDGKSSNTVQTKPSGGYLCGDFFSEKEGQVVCLNWGFLP